MNLSSFDQVAEYVGKLRALEAARDDVMFNPVFARVDGSSGRARHDIGELTSVGRVREALRAILDTEIAGCKAALRTYKVEIDERT